MPKRDDGLEEMFLNAPDDARSFARGHMIASTVLVLVALVAPLAALFEFLKPELEKPDLWFQRSGALMVLFAAWAEYHLLQVQGLLAPIGLAITTQKVLSEAMGPWYKAVHFGALLFVIAGTVIWGYGDILYKIT